MDFDAFQNNRAVGIFDLLSPPLTPLGAVDAQKLLEAVKGCVRSGSKHIVVDGSGLNFLYSDTLNVLGLMGKALKAHNGSLGVLSSHPSVVKAVSAPGLREMILHFSDEAEMLTASVVPEEGAADRIEETVVPTEVPPIADEEEKIASADEEIEGVDGDEPVETENLEDDITQSLPLTEEGIGSAFLESDPSDSTAELPAIGGTEWEEGEMPSGSSEPVERQKKGKKGRVILLVLLALIGAAIALAALGLFPIF